MTLLRCLPALTVMLFALQGCAAIGLTVLGVAAGTASGVGVGHALDGITYKTFTVSVAGVSRATIVTLDRMDIPVMETKDTETGQTIVAQAGDREVEIELDRLTTTTTRMRVVAKKNWLVRDRATASEIILQTDRTLTEQPNVAESKPPVPSQRASQRCAKGARSC